MTSLEVLRMRVENLRQKEYLFLLAYRGALRWQRRLLIKRSSIPEIDYKSSPYGEATAKFYAMLFHRMQYGYRSKGGK